MSDARVERLTARDMIELRDEARRDTNKVSLARYQLRALLDAAERLEGAREFGLRQAERADRAAERVEALERALFVVSNYLDEMFRNGVGDGPNGTQNTAKLLTLARAALSGTARTPQGET